MCLLHTRVCGEGGGFKPLTLLRVNPRTMRNYIASGRLAVFTVGGKGYRIKRDDLDAFVAQTIEERAQNKGASKQYFPDLLINHFLKFDHRI